MSDNSNSIYLNLSADDPDLGTAEIESLCMNCHETGITRMLLTKIPFYKEVVIMSFSCEKCGCTNNEIQSGSEIKPQGIKITFNVEDEKDLNRRCVKSDFSSVRIVELDFEIPAQSQKGEVTTIEGIISRSITGLIQDQNKRRLEHPEIAKQIDEFVDKLEELKLAEKPFTIIIDDISGDAFIENINMPHTDPKLKIESYTRSKEQDHKLGIFNRAEIDEATKSDEIVQKEEQVENNKYLEPINEGAWPLEELHGEVLSFPTKCFKCGKDCETNMKVTKIPHFKDVVIMATTCELCGYRTNEVKSSGGIEEKGTKIEVRIEDAEDFSRDVLKSEFCHLEIRELEVEVGPSALGGRFTTVEGLLVAMKNQLADNNYMFRDSADPLLRTRMDDFLDNFQAVLDCKKAVTVILDDPTGNSYVQALSNDGNPDPRLRITHYHRSHDQNEELGINDMKVEGYETTEVL